jgi:phospholipase C
MPANRAARCGDLRDIKHVMILMQENRSFDHYFGSLSGVRGFGDRATIQLLVPAVHRPPGDRPAQHHRLTERWPDDVGS